MAWFARVYALTYFTTTIFSLRNVISWKFVMNYEILNILSVAQRVIKKLLIWKALSKKKFEGISQFCFDVILTQY